MKIFWFELKKASKQKKDYWISSIGNFNSSSLLGCWQIRISLDDLYKLKKYNSDVNGCISLISQKTSINGLYLEDKNWEVLDKTKFKEEYTYLNKLFTSQTFNFWKENFFTQTTISWENYIEPQYNINNKIIKFATIDSRSMSKLVDENWNITWFKHYPKWVSSRPKEFQPDEIGYFMYRVDVENENLSMWLLDWIIFDVLWDLEANKTNYYFFQNDAIPGAVFMLDKSMSKDQLELASEQIKEKFSWSENKHKFLVSNWVEDVKTLVMSHTDMDFLNQRKFTIDKISATFGVPKELLWYVVDSWSYWKIIEITKEFRNSTIKAYETYLEACINIIISNFSEDLLIDLSEYTIKCDSESFEDRDKIEENQRKDINNWIITINEVRTERWLESFKENFTDVPLIQTNLQLNPKDNTIIN